MCVKPVSQTHFDPPFDFLDVFLPVNASSSSRARAFLWLMFHYLESPAVHNPFSDDYADQHPGKIPRLEMLTPQQKILENVDTEEEIQYGRRMAEYRSKFLQKQIAEEGKDKFGFGGDGVSQGMQKHFHLNAHLFLRPFLLVNFKITPPNDAPVQRPSGQTPHSAKGEPDIAHQKKFPYHAPFGDPSSHRRCSSAYFGKRQHQKHVGNHDIGDTFPFARSALCLNVRFFSCNHLLCTHGTQMPGTWR